MIGKIFREKFEEMKIIMIKFFIGWYSEKDKYDSWEVVE